MNRPMRLLQFIQPRFDLLVAIFRPLLSTFRKNHLRGDMLCAMWHPAMGSMDQIGVRLVLVCLLPAFDFLFVRHLISLPNDERMHPYQ